tara:strand:- start:112 stop:279 length:168 start_codon:yes stop_codon:yes gene_type:complete
MDQNQALQMLVVAVQKAQANGVYSLEEAAALAQAVETFRPPEEAQPEEAPADEEE